MRERGVGTDPGNDGPAKVPDNLRKNQKRYLEHKEEEETRHKGTPSANRKKTLPTLLKKKPEGDGGASRSKERGAGARFPYQRAGTRASGDERREGGGGGGGKNLFANWRGNGRPCA